MVIILLLTLMFGSVYSEPAPIIGGVKVDDTVVSPVVKLTMNDMYGCTATYIGPNAILTASHCVEESFIDRNDNAPLFNKIIENISDPTIEKQNGVAINIFHKTTYKANGVLLNVSKIILNHAADMAIIITKDTVDKYIPVSFEKPEVKQPVVLVGYGMDCNDFICIPGSGVKRIGFNKIDSLTTINDDFSAAIDKAPSINNNKKKAKLFGKELSLELTNDLAKQRLKSDIDHEKEKANKLGVSWGTINIVGLVDYQYIGVPSYKKAAGAHGDSGGPLISEKHGVLGVLRSGINCKWGELYTTQEEQNKYMQQMMLELSYDDLDVYPLLMTSYDCSDDLAGNSRGNFSVSRYSMIKENLSFIKFAVKNGANIKTKFLDKNAYNAARTDNPYFKVYN